MADRNSAEVFGSIFVFLAGNGSKEQLIEFLWRKQGYYDFTEDQMECDSALIELGLARKCGCGGIYYKGEEPDYHTEDICDASQY